LACLQNGQRRGFGIPRQFLYSILVAGRGDPSSVASSLALAAFCDFGKVMSGQTVNAL